MRRINPVRFTVATRGTSREINRSIALNLVRAKQPISRADLARTMGVRRGAVTLIVNDLLRDRLIVEGAYGQTARGRRPKFLYIDSRRRAIAAVDIRATRTFIMLTDRVGQGLTGVVSIQTVRDPQKLAATIGSRVLTLVAEHPDVEGCEGIGVVVPGMIDRSTTTVLHAPTLGWRNVSLREPLVAATGIDDVQIESAGRACVLAQAWGMRDDPATTGPLVFVSVSDGLGVGVMIRGQVLRGRHNIAGEFGHVPLSLDGPRCSCGANGCWEAYVSNRATLARYGGQPIEQLGSGTPGQKALTIDDLLIRARARDPKAAAALESTARYLGLGLASIVNAFDPSRIYIGGEITAAWDLIGPTVRSALVERALIPAIAETEIHPVNPGEHPRLQGAAALVFAPAFAAPEVA
jgi:predicted NBD/HSP70 family sugar kinase